jgi:hypothetical protein
MQNTLFTVLFLASAPIALMPATIAVFTRSHRVVPIVSVNLLVWGGIYLLLRSVVSTSRLPSPGVILLLIAWLALLRFAIQPRRESGSASQAE